MRIQFQFIISNHSKWQCTLLSQRASGGHTLSFFFLYSGDEFGGVAWVKRENNFEEHIYRAIASSNANFVSVQMSRCSLWPSLERPRKWVRIWGTEKPSMWALTYRNIKLIYNLRDRNVVVYDRRAIAINYYIVDLVYKSANTFRQNIKIITYFQ